MVRLAKTEVLFPPGLLVDEERREQGLLSESRKKQCQAGLTEKKAGELLMLEQEARKGEGGLFV